MSFVLTRWFVQLPDFYAIFAGLFGKNEELCGTVADLQGFKWHDGSFGGIVII